MDVMKPELMYLKGRCFRINPMTIDLNDNSGKREWSEHQNYEDEDCTLDYRDPDGYGEGEGEDEEIECKIESADGKKYKTTFHIARFYFPFIIGQKHATRKRLENETKTQINIPKQGQDGDICVIGSSRVGVAAAFRRIHLITMTARKRQQFTHFISIPFSKGQVRDGFLRFKKDVLEKCKGDRGVEEAVFQNPDKLHMTLCTMVLSDDVERSDAIYVLKQCKNDIIDDMLNGYPLKMRISGVEIMNDDPAEARVVYGRVHCDDEETLQMLSDSIVDYIAKAGVMEKEHEKVKMHVTLMNTTFHRHSDLREMKKNQATINATSILKMYENYDFGEVVIDSVHLSQIGAVSNTGYYKPSLVLDLAPAQGV